MGRLEVRTQVVGAFEVWDWDFAAAVGSTHVSSPSHAEGWFERTSFLLQRNLLPPRQLYHLHPKHRPQLMLRARKNVLEHFRADSTPQNLLAYLAAPYRLAGVFAGEG